MQITTYAQAVSSHTTLHRDMPCEELLLLLPACQQPERQQWQWQQQWQQQQQQPHHTMTGSDAGASAGALATRNTTQTTLVEVG